MHQNWTESTSEGPLHICGRGGPPGEIIDPYPILHFRVRFKHPKIIAILISPFRLSQNDRKIMARVGGATQTTFGGGGPPGVTIAKFSI